MQVTLAQVNVHGFICAALIQVSTQIREIRTSREHREHHSCLFPTLPA